MFINNATLFTSLYKSERQLKTSSQRLSSGLRINSAADDPAGLAIATRLKTQIKGVDAGSGNIQSVRSFLETSDSAMGTAADILDQMKDLATQADNGTLSTTDKQSLQDQFSILKDEYDKLTTNTTYNGNKLLDNTNTFSVNTGNGSFTITNQNIKSSSGGDVDIEGLDITSSSGAQTAISQLEKSIDGVAAARSNIGAQMNVLDYREEYNTNHRVALDEARSRIEDADMAREMSEFSKNQILQQTNIQMLQQVDQVNSLFLLLLQ